MSKPKSKHITWQKGHVNSNDRARVLGQKGVVVWLTGLSGSGKSTIARGLEYTLIQQRHPCYVLDGDNIRHGLNKDLGFLPEDRAENIRRIAEVAALLADAGLIVITAFISPYRQGREHARLTAKDAFVEVFCDASVSTCEQRDPKGLYKKARNGQIKDFTGIDAPYEEPLAPDVHLNTSGTSVDSCVQTLFDYLQDHGYLINDQA